MRNNLRQKNACPFSHSLPRCNLCAIVLFQHASEWVRAGKGWKWPKSLLPFFPPFIVTELFLWWWTWAAFAATIWQKHAMYVEGKFLTSVSVSLEFYLRTLAFELRNKSWGRMDGRWLNECNWIVVFYIHWGGETHNDVMKLMTF